MNKIECKNLLYSLEVLLGQIFIYLKNCHTTASSRDKSKYFEIIKLLLIEMSIKLGICRPNLYGWPLNGDREKKLSILV